MKFTFNINFKTDKMINIFLHIHKDFTNAQLQNAYFYLKDEMDVEVYNIQEMICHALLMSYGNVDGAISYIVDWVYESNQKEKVKVKLEFYKKYDSRKIDR